MKARKGPQHQKSGLELPKISSRDEIIEFMNSCTNFRPRAKVVYIKESKQFDTDQLCTIKLDTKTK
jgi:hypothetical protein